MVGICSKIIYKNINSYIEEWILVYYMYMSIELDKLVEFSLFFWILKIMFWASASYDIMDRMNN